MAWNMIPPWEYEYVAPTEDEKMLLQLSPTDRRLKTFVFRSQMLRGLDEESSDERETLLEQVLRGDENIRVGVYKNARIGDNIVIVCSQRALDYVRQYYEQYFKDSEGIEETLRQKRALFKGYTGKIIAFARALDNPSYDGRGMNYSVPICDLHVLQQPIDISFFENCNGYRHIRSKQITRISNTEWNRLYEKVLNELGQ